jgi:Domain of unknown function (DUF3883)
MAEGRLPTRHELRCALHAARALHAPTTMLADARESFRALPSSGLIGLDDFDAGAELLSGLGLIAREGEILVVIGDLRSFAQMQEKAALRLLLDLHLRKRPPDWLRAAAGKEALNRAVIPDGDFSTVAAVVTDPDLREVLLLEAGRRFNAERLAGLATIGEEHVVGLCRVELLAAQRSDLAEQVTRVSLFADDLGYDVTAPTLGGESRRLEVKATRGGDIYISRNEYRIGSQDPDWALVVVGIDAYDQPQLWGWLRATALDGLIPLDRDDRGCWQSARLLGIRNRLGPGLPPI